MPWSRHAKRAQCRVTKGELQGVSKFEFSERNRRERHPGNGMLALSRFVLTFHPHVSPLTSHLPTPNQTTLSKHILKAI